MEVEKSGSTQRPQVSRHQPRGPNLARKSPTHFLAIRIVSDSVIKAVADVQSRLLQLDPSLQRDLIKAPKLHMTLCVMCLDTNERIEEAKKRLHSSVEVLTRHYPSNGPRLDFAALSHFRNRILYLEAAENVERTKLKEFVREMTAHFQGIATVENREWTPHVTVYKPRTNRACLPDSVSSILQTRCGTHEFLHVDLLRMSGKGVGGYYPCLASIPFGTNVPATHSIAVPIAAVQPEGGESSDDEGDE